MFRSLLGHCVRALQHHSRKWYPVYSPFRGVDRPMLSADVIYPLLLFFCVVAFVGYYEYRPILFFSSTSSVRISGTYRVLSSPSFFRNHVGENNISMKRDWQEVLPSSTSLLAFLFTTLASLPLDAVDVTFPGQKSSGKGFQLRGDCCCARPKAEVGGSDASEAAQGSYSRVSASGEIRVHWKAASARCPRCTAAPLSLQGDCGTMLLSVSVNREISTAGNSSRTEPTFGDKILEFGVKELYIFALVKG